MKIAVVSNNGEKVSRHFGKARYFVVLTVENGEVVARDVRSRRPGQGSGQNGHDSAVGEPRGHGRRAVGLVSDCRAVIAGGMGASALANLRLMGVDAVATDERVVDEAALRYARGELPHRNDLVHEGGDDLPAPVRFIETAPSRKPGTGA